MIRVWISTMFLAAECGVLQAATLRVNTHGTGDYPTIQASIEASADGDIILLADGIYHGDGNRDIRYQGKAVTIQSENGPEDCIIDCEGSDSENHRGFHFNSGEGAGSILDGVTIRNGYLSVGGNLGAGGAIQCYNASPTISNCIFENNQAVSGGALRLHSSDSIVSNCFIRNNIGEIGTVSVSGENPQFIDCAIIGNSTDYYGGGINAVETQATFTRCLIEENFCNDVGGGAYCYKGSPIFNDCLIRRNSARVAAGGLFCLEGSTVTLTDCVIDGNITENGDGGGVCSAEAAVTLQRCFIRNNRAFTYGGGGAVYQSTLSLVNTVIVGNAARSGGGMYVQDSHLDMTHCTCAENEALYSGGGVYLYSAGVGNFSGCILWENQNNNGSEGDQLIVVGAGSQATLSDCDVTDGQSGTVDEDGGGINWGTGNIDSDPLFVGEGAWYDNETPATATDDVWLPGDYQLMPGSPCIDAATPPPGIGDYDAIGNTRIVNSAIDLGSYESQFSAIHCTKLTLKADKTRSGENPIADSFALAGNFNDTTPTEDDFEDADTCTVRVGAWSQTVETNLFRGGGNSHKYTFRGQAPGLTSLTLDFRKNSFKAAAKNIDLTGSDAPLPVAISFGTYYGYQSLVDDGDVDDVINKIKSIPIQYMVDDTDTLRITKVKCTDDNEGYIGNLTIQGEIALNTPIDLTAVVTTLTWGAATVLTIPAGDFEDVKEGVYRCNYGDGDFSAKATFDFNKCKFQITLKNTDVAWQDGPINVRLQLGAEFDQTVLGVDD